MRPYFIARIKIKHNKKLFLTKTNLNILQGKSQNFPQKCNIKISSLSWAMYNYFSLNITNRAKSNFDTFSHMILIKNGEKFGELEYMG